MKKCSILVVEDEALIAANLVHTLSSLGYEVHEPVAKGEDAIRAVEGQQPDLVLMDIQLIGEMDGIEAAEKIRAIADIPIVYLTAFSDDLRLKQAQLTEPYGYIVKPAHSRELHATIEMALYKHGLDRKLKESEEKYRNLSTMMHLMCDNMPDMIWAKDLEKRYIFANKAICSDLLNAADTDEPTGKLDMFFAERERIRHADDPEWHTFGEICRDTDQVTMDAGTPQQFDEYGNVQGKYLFLDVHKAPFIDGQGKMIGTVGSARDITERKRAEEALRESEELLRDIIEKNPMSIQIVDREGFTLRVNPAFIRLFGSVPPPDFSIIMDLVKSRPELENHISRVKNGEPVNLPDMSFNPHDIYPELPDVPTRVRAIIFPLNDRHGKPQRFIFMHEDITEQRRAEEALRQSNRKLTLLSGITRHDINNQITVLVGYLRILEKKQPDTTHNEYFQKIAIATQRISAMVQFTKEYEEIGVKAPTWQDIRTLVDTAAKEAPLGRVIVKNDLPLGAEIFADPLITKVFYNLMDNAVRYGGKITTIRFSATEAGDEHLIVCEDDGVGVPAEEKEKIFERGFGKNTGLGLALSREILAITGITIRETGEPGKGARFEIIVPKGAWRMTENGD